MQKFIEELKERGVLRAAGLYIALAWLLLQIGDVVFPAFDIPDSTLRYIFLGAIIGFPIAMLVSWFYDISPDGIRSEDDIREAGEKRSRGLISSVTLVFLALALGASLYGNFKQANNAEAAPPALASVLMADWTNSTGDKSLDYALQPTLITGIERAPFIGVFSRNSTELFRDNRNPPLDEKAALELASREGIQFIVAANIQPDGDAYALSARAITPQDGESVFEVNTTAQSNDELLPAVAELAQLIREEFGDSPGEEPQSSSTILVGDSLLSAGLYASADAHASDGDWEQAIENYAKAIDADPGFGMAYLGWALSLQQLNQLEASKLQWQEVLGNLESLSERQRYRALALHAANSESDYEKATANYDLLIENYPAEVVGRSELGGLHFEAHRFDQAFTQIAVLRDRYPSNLAYQARYARYAMYAGEFEISSQQAEKNLKRDPESVLPYLQIAMAKLARGEISTAEKSYRTMARQDPLASSLAITGRVDIALLQGNYAAAIELLDSAQPASGTSGNSSIAVHHNIYRAIALHGLGDDTAAGKRIEAILPTIDKVSGLLVAGQLLVTLGELETAKSIVARLNMRKSNAGTAEADLLAGAIALAEARFVDAVDLLVASIADTDTWLARFTLGQTYALADYQAEALGEFKQCEDRLGEATALFLDDIPTFHYSAPLYLWLAKTKQQLGMSREATADYERYLDLRVATDASQLTIDARTRLEKISSR